MRRATTRRRPCARAPPTSTTSGARSRRRSTNAAPSSHSPSSSTRGRSRSAARSSTFYGCVMTSNFWSMNDGKTQYLPLCQSLWLGGYGPVILPPRNEERGTRNEKREKYSPIKNQQLGEFICWNEKTLRCSRSDSPSIFCHRKKILTNQREV